ncbi:MAG: hypothetical protein HC852_21095 [Acaryochloridaceae cyanobacterium RU_4_10]|nr:hypothetical protein [Acaryochloridaceae cyanobacterium RU_4_10]
MFLLLDGCPGLEVEVDHAGDTVKNHLQHWFRATRNDLQLYALLIYRLSLKIQVESNYCWNV